MNVALLICTHMFLLSEVTVSAGKKQNEVLHRTIRSPQFLSGKNVLTDLTQQIKPPSLNDFNQLRQKMANFANLTALLEHSIAAEKAARSKLQNVLTTVKEQIVGVKTAVNPDPENYWTESKKCGGILISQTGRISYKNGYNYEDNERCIWTVRANYRSNIKVTFTSGNLEDSFDFVSVTDILEEMNQWETKRIKTGQTYIFNGPLIFITFSSDNSVRKTGLELNFEGMGNNIYTRTTYLHFHLTDCMGQFDSFNISESLKERSIELGDGDEIKATILINPSFWNSKKLSLSIPNQSIDLKAADCENTNLAVLYDFMERSQGQIDKCCAESCEKLDFTTSNKIIMAVFSLKDVSSESQFKINWNTNTIFPCAISENECGGVLNGDIGEISYKLDSTYDANERCVWAIIGERGKKAKIKIQLVKDGFEYKYDYVTSAYFEDDDWDSDIKTKYFHATGPLETIPSTLAFIQFYSDSATYGTGFKLIWEMKYYSTEQLPTIQVDHRTEESHTLSIECSDQQAYKATIINPILTSVSLTVLMPEMRKSTQNLLVVDSTKGSFARSIMIDNQRKYSSEVFITLVKCPPDEDKIVGEIKLVWEKAENFSYANGQDDVIFVKSEDTCGELLYGDSGKISYKLEKEYEVNERCTWIIQTKTFSTVSVGLLADGLESCCDKILVNKIDVQTGTMDTNAVNIDRENRFQTLEGPILLLTFHSDHSVVGTGFELEFKTKGERTLDVNSSQVSTSYVATPFNSNENIEIPVFNKAFSDNEDTQIPSVDINMLHVKGQVNVTLQFSLLHEECTKHVASIYEMATGKSQYEFIMQHLPETCPSEERRTLSGPTGIVIMITS